MNEIYHYVGIIATWLIIVLACIFTVYSVIFLFKVLRIRIKVMNWYSFYIKKYKVETPILRKNYKTFWIVNKKDNKKYLLLYRLRNIKNTCRSK